MVGKGNLIQDTGGLFSQEKENKNLHDGTKVGLKGNDLVCYIQAVYVFPDDATLCLKSLETARVEGIPLQRY